MYKLKLVLIEENTGENLYDHRLYKAFLNMTPKITAIKVKTIVKLDLTKWKKYVLQKTFSSVQFSCSVMSDFLRPHGLQYARPPCPSPTPGVHPNSRPSSRWCHTTISYSAVPFSSGLQSFPASVSFQISQLCASGAPKIGVSASTSVHPMNTQD